MHVHLPAADGWLCLNALTSQTIDFDEGTTANASKLIVSHKSGVVDLFHAVANTFMTETR